MVNTVNIARRIGMDKAIAYTITGKMFQFFTAAFSVIFIARYLSQDEQGYYYTFGSIIAIQVFFELGLTTIITQFVAHEASFLKINDNIIEGVKRHQSRLASILSICIRWYSIISIFLFVLLLISGYIFFTTYNKEECDISWSWPWLLLVVGTILQFIIAPLVSFIEGLGYVKDIARFRLIQQIIQPIVMWGGLYLDVGLYVPGADALIRTLVIITLIIKSPILKIICKIRRIEITDKVSYISEIFPYQWKIALSWISGYFVFQFFNPVLFAFEGALVAGKMGMTMQALNAIQALMLAWINTKVPRLATFIARKEYKELDDLFYLTFKQILLLGFIVIFIFYLTIAIIQYFDLSFFSINIGERFISGIPLFLMVASVYLMFPINCWAIYLRSHKREPLLLNSVVIGLLCCFLTFILTKIGGVLFLTIGFFSLRVISMLWIFRIFKNKKRIWHQ